MLRRRILASAMASVMAIGSVAVVASADETAASTTQAKTKADLEAYVKSFDKFREDTIYDYGAIASKNFLDAIEYADLVLDDATADAEDYTVAYQMLSSVYANMKIYTSAELKSLLDTTKKTYETDNLLNADTADEIYYNEADNPTWDNFKNAYEYADSVVGSSDSRLVTDAYSALNNSYKNLKALTVVTKSAFRSALKGYESLIAKKNAYDDWRRGTMTGWVSSDACKNYWAFAQTKAIGGAEGVIDFDTVKDIVFGDGILPMGGWTATIFNVTGNVDDYINNAYNTFDGYETVNKTTNPVLINAYQIALDAVQVFNNFVPDDTNRASKVAVTKLLDQYHNNMVDTFRTTTAQNLYLAITGSAYSDTYAIPARVYSKDLPAALVEEYDLPTAIAKGTDVRKFIDVDYNGAYFDRDSEKGEILYLPLRAAQKYVDGAYSDTVWGLDESGTVNTGNGSAAEWAIVYRALKYALADAYPAGDATYTKKDVAELVEKSYDLADLTGDAYVFSENHKALVTARQAALEWLRAANTDKSYKDGDAKLGKTSTTVYNELKTAYKNLSDQFDKYKYSYGEIYAKLSEVAAKIDAGELTATEKLVAAADKVAYTLSTIGANDGEISDPVNNAVFTIDRDFNDFNRLFTDSNNATQAEKNFKADYEALLAEVAAQATPDVVLGDVDGNGVVNALDASAILKAVVSNTAIDTKVGDYNSDGAVNALDAAAILKFVVSQ